MDANEQFPTSEPLRASRIPIAQLSPTLEHFSESSIHASVTLLWPYSSSTKTLSLLLAEPDFRLRHSNGQVKAVFHGHIAESVAKSQIGIGDSIYLSLNGARLSDNVTAPGTPGRSVAWDIHFDDRVFLEIWRSLNHVSTVKVDPPTPSPNDTTDAPPATPIAKGYDRSDRNLLIDGLSSWQSPAFLGRSRTSLGGLADSVLDQFAEEDGFVPGKGRKRPRFSMRSSEWRVIDEPESPGERGEVPDWTHIFDEDWGSEPEPGPEDLSEKEERPPDATKIKNTGIDSEDVSLTVPASEADVAMENASLASSRTSPERHIAQTVDGIRLPPHGISGIAEFSRKRGVLNCSTHLPIETPRLHPIPSPGLPVPSPLVTMSNSPQGYFTPAAATAHSHTSQIPTTLSREVTDLENEMPVAQPDTPQTPECKETVITSGTKDRAIGVPEFTLESNATKITLKATSQPHTMANTGLKGLLPDEDSKAAAEPAQVHQFTPHISEKDTGKLDEHLGDTDQLKSLNRVGKEFELDETCTDAQMKAESEKDKGETHQEQEVVKEHKLEDNGHIFTRTSKSLVPGDTRASGVANVVEYGTDGSGEEDTEALKRSRHYHDLAAESETYTPETDREHPTEAALEGENKWEGKESEGEYEEELEEEEEPEEEQAQGIKETDREGDADNEEMERDDLEEEEEEEEVEDRYEDEYGDGAESEIVSDQMSIDTPTQPPAMKNVHPEVIVLDSDSEDEATPASQAYPMTTSRDEANTQEIESSELEASASEEGSLRSRRSDNSESSEDEEGEDWSDENSEDEQLLDKNGGEMMEDERGRANGEQQRAGHAVDELSDNGSTRGEKVDEDSVDAHEEYEADNEAMEEQPETKRGQVSVSQPMDIRDAGSDTDEPTPQHYQLGHTIRAPSHDSEQRNLDYHTCTMASAQEPHPDSRTTLPEFETVIDPELQNIGLAKEQENKDVEEEHRSDSIYAEPRTDVSANIPEPVQDIDQGLVLDGTSSSQASHDSREAVSEKPLQLQHSIPMETQLAEVGQPSMDFTTTGILPTSEHVQRKPTVQSQGQMPPAIQIRTIAPAERHLNVAEDVEHELEEFSADGVVGTPASFSGDQAQADELYSDDESVGDLDEVHLIGIDRHYPGLHSQLSYLAPLATLVDHYNALVDTISVVSEVQPVFRAASGKKDFILILQLTDQSMAGTTLYAQIFRPSKVALPSVEEGNVVLLRNFRVKSFNRSIMLISLDTSAWAVFKGLDDKALTHDPPVEYGSEEEACATDLRQWYQETGMAMVADNQLQASINRESREGTPTSSAALSDSGSIESTLRDARGESSFSSRGSRRGKKSHRRITIHELRDGRRYTEVGSPSGKESIHELRDGTVYANL
ncbi:hypothetical protein BDV39DRAFT_59413 [Aspergillus sergii]|uniref:Telomeric single stranded DNA binding POT1/Cdc13 domain-containing protein n=1 Tax=Aspergillus sergii TaxID=1034303 RepID=A0A5N6X6R8_9EURO|nr:hypothetical protein BDV39DRAFT_59413 [Aspergillus sergii]